MGLFTKFPQYKNANIGNFVLTTPLERPMKTAIYECYRFKPTDIYFHIY